MKPPITRKDFEQWLGPGPVGVVLVLLLCAMIGCAIFKIIEVRQSTFAFSSISIPDATVPILLDTKTGESYQFVFGDDDRPSGWVKLHYYERLPRRPQEQFEERGR